MDQFIAKRPTRYYWVTPQSEYATDLVFKSRQHLTEFFPRLLAHSILCFFSARDVMSLLGRKWHGKFEDEVVTDQEDLRGRLPGCRVKHRMEECDLPVPVSRQSAQVSRLLHRFHVYGQVAKILRSRRWRVTTFGQRIMSTSVKLRHWQFPDGTPRRRELPETASKRSESQRRSRRVTTSRTSLWTGGPGR